MFDGGTDKSPLFINCNVNLYKASHGIGTGEAGINKHKAPLTNYKRNPDPFTHKVPNHSIIIVTYHIIYIFQKMECHILWNVHF